MIGEIPIEIDANWGNSKVTYGYSVRRLFTENREKSLSMTDSFTRRIILVEYHMFVRFTMTHKEYFYDTFPCTCLSRDYEIILLRPSIEPKICLEHSTIKSAHGIKRIVLCCDIYNQINSVVSNIETHIVTNGDIIRLIGYIIPPE